MDSTHLSSRCAIAIMAKAPQPGRSKTRLCPPLTHAEAAWLSGAFLADMTATIQRAASEAAIDGFVAYAPTGSEALLAPYLAPNIGLVLADGVVDTPGGIAGFGRSLFHALRTLLAMGYGSVCLVNSDSPTLPARLLVQAAARLAEPGDRAVLGAAEDGGYYLLGLKAAHAALFSGIAWSTEQVARQTRAQAERLELALFELEPWYDVDDAASLARLLAALEEHDLDRPVSSLDVIDSLGLRDRVGRAA